MLWALEEMKSRAYFNHLGKWQRVKIFMRTKRRRFFYIFLFVMAFNWFGNVVGFFLARMERSGRKYKKQWIMNNNPAIMSFMTAVDN
jgi:hypothetical protein